MEEQLRNEQVDISGLPSITTLDLHGLHKDYLTAIAIRSVLFWLIVSLAVGIGNIFIIDKIPGYLRYSAFGILGIVILVNFVLLVWGFRRKKYALRERDILYQTGLLWRSTMVIPFNRIQHAEVSQGPIERLFDLSVLRIFTAGGSMSDMIIPGLRPDIAHNIKEYILRKTAQDEEE